MNFFKIKFFPHKIADYLYFFFSNTVFLIIFIILIEIVIEEKNKNENISEVMLFIPKIGYDFEEKRDLIFNQLSANSSIISVNKLEDKEIIELLSDLLKKIELSDDIIPEVYEVQVEQSKPLNFTSINNKITKIINGALIKKLGYKKSNIVLLFLTIFTILIFIILLNNFFIVKNYLLKIKNYINLSRYFGVNDSIIIRNLNMTFFILLTLVFLSSYPIVKILLESYFYYSLLNDFFKIYLAIYLLYNFIFLSILSIQCTMYMKKLNVL